jgi:antigen flippase
MLSALAGTVLTVILVYLMGANGIVPALLAGAVAALAVIRLYARRTGIARAPALPSVRAHAGPLLRLGLVFMVSGLLTTGAAYGIRIIVLHEAGVDAAGLYQSAWALAALYAGFVLQAMGTDFYPRLTASGRDDLTCNRLVNEQARVSMLLAGPGVIGTITLAPIILTVFYSGAFVDAVPTLRWLCLGMMLRVVSWPIGFIMLARDAKKAFFWTEVIVTAVHVGLAALLVPLVGVTGAGMAFCGLYLCHVALVYRLVQSISGFRWSGDNLRLGAAYLGAATLSFGAFSVLPAEWATAFGLLLCVACGWFSLRELVSLVPESSMPRIVRPITLLLYPRQRRA